MFAASFAEANAVLDKPADSSYDECECLAVAHTHMADSGLLVVVSCWKPTREELDEINRTGRVWLVVQGDTMPPARLFGVSPFVAGG